MTSKIGYEKKVFSASFQFHSDKINYLAFGKVRSRLYTHSHRALLVGNDVLISNSRADDDDNEITHEKKCTVCLVVISCTSRVSTAARKKNIILFVQTKLRSRFIFFNPNGSIEFIVPRSALQTRVCERRMFLFASEVQPRCFVCSQTLSENSTIIPSAYKLSWYGLCVVQCSFTQCGWNHQISSLAFRVCGTTSRRYIFDIKNNMKRWARKNYIFLAASRSGINLPSIKKTTNSVGGGKMKAAANFASK